MPVVPPQFNELWSICDHENLPMWHLNLAEYTAKELGFVFKRFPKIKVWSFGMDLWKNPHSEGLSDTNVDCQTTSKWTLFPCCWQLTFASWNWWKQTIRMSRSPVFAFGVKDLWLVRIEHIVRGSGQTHSSLISQHSTSTQIHCGAYDLY